MSSLQRKLATLSRDRNFLIRGVLVILGVAVVLGLLVTRAKSPKLGAEGVEEMIVNRIIAYESERDRGELADLLFVRGQPTPEAIALYIEFINVFIEKNLVSNPAAREFVTSNVSTLGAAKMTIDHYQSSLTPEQFELFHNYAVALYKKDEKKDVALEFLREQAAAEPPRRFANEFLGQVLARRGSEEESIGHFEREAMAFERSDFARFRQMSLELRLKHFDKLRALLKKPDYRRLASSDFLTEAGIEMRDPLVILKGTASIPLRRFSSVMMPLAVFAGTVWFLVVAKLGGVHRALSGRLLLYFLGVVAGVLSTPVTFVFITWQDEIVGLKMNGDFLNDLLYCLSGVGLREELAKLILFLPFVPFIAKRRTSIEVLITASCVGLGFAISENIGYFTRGGPAGAFPRLVTASFLHISFTGLAGLALCRFWHWPKRCWEEFVTTFVAVVLIHGAYDAFLMVGQLKELEILSFIIFVLVVRHFLRKAIELGEQNLQAISPLGVFVLGATLVIAFSWVYGMHLFGTDYTLDGVGKAAFSSAVLAFVYINELRNH